MVNQELMIPSALAGVVVDELMLNSELSVVEHQEIALPSHV